MENEYLRAVQQLNDDLYETHGDTDELFFYTASGYVDIIGFGDTSLWDSENDIREFDEELNEYEPMIPYIRRKLSEYATKLIKYSLEPIVKG